MKAKETPKRRSAASRCRPGTSRRRCRGPGSARAAWCRPSRADRCRRSVAHPAAVARRLGPGSERLPEQAESRPSTSSAASAPSSCDAERGQGRIPRPSALRLENRGGAPRPRPGSLPVAASLCLRTRPLNRGVCPTIRFPAQGTRVLWVGRLGGAPVDSAGRVRISARIDTCPGGGMVDALVSGTSDLTVVEVRSSPPGAPQSAQQSIDIQRYFRLLRSIVRLLIRLSELESSALARPGGTAQRRPLPATKRS